MHNIKTYYIHQNLWCGILALALIVCPILSMADQHNAGTESQKTADIQNQISSTSTQRASQNTSTDMLIELEEMLMTRYTLPLVVLGILLFGILTLLVWMLLRHKSLSQQLEQLSEHVGQIEISMKDSSNVNDNFLDMGVLVQVLTEIAENSRYIALASETLHQKLAHGIETLMDIKGILQNRDSSQSQNINSSCQEGEQIPVPPQGIEESPQLPESEPSNQMSPILQEFCELYNTGKKNELQERYQPNHRIGVDASERRWNPNEPPIFETDSAGNFLSYFIDSEDLYAVVPRHNLILQDSLYGPGAFSEVFECLGFTPQHRYQIKLVQPAHFKRDLAKETWTLEQRGILELEIV